jgi:tetratricopeptide (TPR) repeat protein
MMLLVNCFRQQRHGYSSYINIPMQPFPERMPNFESMSPQNTINPTDASEQKATGLPSEYALVTRNRLAKAYAELGNTLYDQNQFEQAIAHFQKILREMPDLPNSELAKVHCNIGLSQAKQFDFDQAIASFKTALGLDPGLTLAQFHIERIEYERRNILKGYQFAQDRFSRNIRHLKKWLHPFANQPEIKALEIGGWDGRATCWLLENVLTHDSARITCVGSFKGDAEHQLQSSQNSIKSVAPKFDANIQKTGAAKKVEKIVGRSEEILRSLSLDTYHFIYVDDSLIPSDVLTDAVLSWGLLKIKGLLILNNYDFGERHPKYNTRLGIDAFLASFIDKAHILHRTHLVVVEKNSITPY